MILPATVMALPTESCMHVKRIFPLQDNKWFHFGQSNDYHASDALPTVYKVSDVLSATQKKRKGIFVLRTAICAVQHLYVIEIVLLISTAFLLPLRKMPSHGMQNWFRA